MTLADEKQGFSRRLREALRKAYPGPVSPTGIFADVPTSYVFAGHIEKFYQLGITTGCAVQPLRYCPSANVDRAAMAVFITRALGEDPIDPATGLFADVSVSNWWAGHVEKFYALGITTGCAVNPLRFCPGQVVDRAAMAVFIVRAFDIPI